MNNGTKQCTSCNLEKNLDEFSPDKRSKDGKHSYCKPCRRTKINQRNKILKDAKNAKMKEVLSERIDAYAAEYLSVCKRDQSRSIEILKILQQLHEQKKIEDKATPDNSFIVTKKQLQGRAQISDEVERALTDVASAINTIIIFQLIQIRGSIIPHSSVLAHEVKDGYRIVLDDIVLSDEEKTFINGMLSQWDA